MKCGVLTVRLTMEQFAFQVIQRVTTLKYAYKETIYGCIQALRVNYELQCDATDDEIYEIVKQSLLRIPEVRCTLEDCNSAVS